MNVGGGGGGGVGRVSAIVLMRNKKIISQLSSNTPSFISRALNLFLNHYMTIPIFRVYII